MADDRKSTQIQEMERRANDLIRVYNPLDKDYVIEWDRANGTKLFRVPAKQEAVLVRYIAEKYIKEMYRKIINEKAIDAVRSENQKRIEKGMAEMDRTMRSGEQMRFEQRFYNLSDDDARKIVSMLYVGLEQRFGVDTETVAEDTVDTADSRSVFDRIFSDVEEKKELGGSETTLNRQVDNELTDTTVEPSVPSLKCDFPGCDFETKHSLGLQGHKRSHRKDLLGNDDLDAKKQEAVSQISK